MNKALKKLLKPLRIMKQNKCFRDSNKYGKNINNRHIVVIESDDWGSIRIPSDYVKEVLNSKGAKLDNEPFTRWDGLESAEDILALTNELSKITDIHGRHPIITAFYAIANADFQAIKQNEYSKFESESFLTTSKKYDGKDILPFVANAINKGVFCPELHCYEHLNRKKWLMDLQSGRLDTFMAFDYGVYGLGTNFEQSNPYGYMDAFHNRSEEELLGYRKLICDAVSEFKTIFGYSPRAFTAPCYVWDKKIEDYLHENGIKCICGSNYQLIPIKDDYDNMYRNVHHFGDMNEQGMVYLTRNVIYELIYDESESKEIAMRQIAAAFHENKPAIISIHRANFSNRIGSNRDIRLNAIVNFLSDIQKKWPDVEFMSSYELCELVKGDFLDA